MSHLRAAGFGIAVTAVLLAVYIGRPAAVAPAAPAFIEDLPLAKGDRLDGGVPKPPPPPKQPQPPPPAAVMQNALQTAPAAAPVVQSAVHPHDAVCGAKGRTWYTRDNGWRYWRCNR